MEIPVIFIGASRLLLLWEITYFLIEGNAKFQLKVSDNSILYIFPYSVLVLNLLRT